MSKPLKSFPEKDRMAVARRRVATQTGGLGWLSAVDFLKKKGEKVPTEK